MTKTKIKERPILFSGEMVRAILDGRKTQTRRAVKQKVVDWLPTLSSIEQAGLRKNGLCPYGYAGDRLYVRETWAKNNLPIGSPYIYRSTEEQDGIMYGGNWRPSIHMPRAASRLLLEITDVRVERLHDISEADAISEGVEFKRVGITQAATGWKHYKSGFYNAPSARESFFTLWESINGPESLESNPWVWVVSFKQVEQ